VKAVPLQPTNGAFPTRRHAALALLLSGCKLTRKAGQFLGQIVADPAPLSEAQSAWLDHLLSRAALPPLADDGSV